MATTMSRQRAALGALLVALQLALIAWLAWSGLLALSTAPMPADAALVGALGTALAVASLLANRPGNFSVMPAPKPHGRLVTSGPYRWIRHPMYSAVLALAIACAMTAGSASSWLAVPALALVLLVKSTLEERWMALQHPGYEAYRAATHRFLPGIF